MSQFRVWVINLKVPLNFIPVFYTTSLAIQLFPAVSLGYSKYIKIAF